MNGVFVVGGTMQPDAATYIQRRGDKELEDAIMDGDYCSVLSTRQMGKSSLMARTAKRLREQGVTCAAIDLQGSSHDPNQWYYSFVKQLIVAIGLDLDLPDWWRKQESLSPAQRLLDILADVVLKNTSGQIIVFVDEVDWMIRVPFSDEFFAAIRSCFNRRALDPSFRRLVFVLLGSATPAQLIKDSTRTPFNISKGIELTDFSFDEAKPLACWLGDDGEQVLRRILYWTDGHPYLTHMLCQKAAESEIREDAVDDLVREELLSTRALQEELNLKFVADRLAEKTGDLRRLLQIYREVLRGKSIRDIPSSRLHASLRLSGAVKANAEGLFIIRNRVYSMVFDESWVAEKAPPSLSAAFLGGLAMVLAAFAILYIFFLPKGSVGRLESTSDPEIAYEAYDQLRNSVYRSGADPLLAQFFERRGLRDFAILVEARATDLGGLADLIGTDYPLLRRTFRHNGPVTAVALSPDGRLLATASYDQSRIFEMLSGREVSRLAGANDVSSLVFSFGGRMVATASSDNTAQLFDVESGRQLALLGSSINAVAFSPDDKLVGTGSSDNMARVFEVSTGRESRRFPHHGAVYAIAFSPDGRWLATSCSDNAAHVFDIATGVEKWRFAHEESVSALAFSPDGKLVATGSDDNTSRVFQLATGREVSRLVHDGRVNSVKFSPDGTLIATGSSDYTSRVFRAATGTELTRFANEGSVNSVAFSPDGKLVASGSEDGTTRVFDVDQGRELSRLDQEGAVNSVVFSPDGNFVVSGSDDNTARIIKIPARWPTLNPRRSTPVLAVAFSGDHKLMATETWHGTTQIFESTSGRELLRLTERDSGKAIAFGANGKLLAIGSNKGKILIYESNTGREIMRLSSDDAVNAVAFSPDAKFVATASNDKTTRVFETDSGRQILQFEHEGAVNALAFSSDGKMLATGSVGVLNATVKIFRVGESVESSVFECQKSITGIAFSGDDRIIIQSRNWLTLYARHDNSWKPIGSHFFAASWPNTVRFVASARQCSNCAEAVRDIPQDNLKLETVTFNMRHIPTTDRHPDQLISAWGAKLDLRFSPNGRIVPFLPPERK